MPSLAVPACCVIVLPTSLSTNSTVSYGTWCSWHDAENEAGGEGDNRTLEIGWAGRSEKQLCSAVESHPSLAPTWQHSTPTHKSAPYEYTHMHAHARTYNKPIDPSWKNWFSLCRALTQLGLAARLFPQISRLHTQKSYQPDKARQRARGQKLGLRKRGRPRTQRTWMMCRRMIGLSERSLANWYYPPFDAANDKPPAKAEPPRASFLSLRLCAKQLENALACEPSGEGGTWSGFRQAQLPTKKNGNLNNKQVKMPEHIDVASFWKAGIR